MHSSEFSINPRYIPGCWADEVRTTATTKEVVSTHKQQPGVTFCPACLPQGAFLGDEVTDQSPLTMAGGERPNLVARLAGVVDVPTIAQRIKTKDYRDYKLT